MPISEELKAKMAEGRRKAKAEREARRPEPDTDAGPGIASPEALEEMGYSVDWPKVPTAAAEPEEIVDLAMTEEDRSRPEPDPDPLPDPTSPFEVFVASLSEETQAELSYSELREIFEQNEREARAEKRKLLRAAAAAKAKDYARASVGVLTPAEVERKHLAAFNSRKVRVTPKMPFVTDNGGIGADGITLDGVKYLHGQTYTLTMGQALVLRDIIYNNQQGELTFEGKGRLNGLRQQRFDMINEARYV